MIAIERSPFSEVIEAADKAGISMVFTAMPHFRH